MQSIGSLENPSSNDILKCQTFIRNLEQNDKTVVLQWIPANCGIHGNDQADLLAKKGAGVLQLVNDNIPFSTLKRQIKRMVSSRYQEELSHRIASKDWRILRSIIIPDAPRDEAVASFRLITGHDCLAAHLFRIGVLPDPNCTLCGDDFMDGFHILHCRALRGSTLVERYWEARNRMRQ